MTFKVRVGPTQIAIHQGQTVLVTRPDGQILSPSRHGLFFRDTRLICSWKVLINGQTWKLLNGCATAAHAARIIAINPSVEAQNGPIASGTLGLMIERAIKSGVHEDITIRNSGLTPVQFILEIEIRSDFADIFEVKGKEVLPLRNISSSWSSKEQALWVKHRHSDFYRAFVVRLKREDVPAANVNGRLRFDVDLKAGQSWHRCLLYDLVDGDNRLAAPRSCMRNADVAGHAQAVKDWRQKAMKIETSNEDFRRCYDQGILDMAALRLEMNETGRTVYIPAAGLPWFVALFGRDTLIASLQTLMVSPEFAAGTLEILGHLQARTRDDYRDAEPGKILHELRCGELAHFRLIPHTPYYGSADSTPLYLIALHATWKATGDWALLDRLMPHAEACLAWIDNYGDRDGDGFQEYETRSKDGYENMSWKDAGNAIVYPGGTMVSGPKALCELQGYVYDAWLRMAEIYEERGNAHRAKALRHRASSLFRRFNEAFWDEKLGFYALALDGKKHKVLSIASNIGHCLWSGIISPNRAERVVRRLLRDDMWSGWGIRTLSARHPAFNPYDYQTGAIWPHDNALIALGMRRYGFDAEATKVAAGILAAARHFLFDQLPELYAGLARDETDFPVQYLGANVPQAWAAGTPFMLLQAILGLQHNAPHGEVWVDPVLPDWLPDVTLTDFQLGRSRFDIHFWRNGEKTEFDVTKGKRNAVLLKSFTRAGGK